MKQLFVIVALFILLIACSDSLPYKSAADTRPLGGRASPLTGAAAAVPAKKPVPSGPHCVDTDYGELTSAKGIVSGVDATGNTFNNEDLCFGNRLVEYYCDTNNPASKNILCERGCQNGFCI